MVSFCLTGTGAIIISFCCDQFCGIYVLLFESVQDHRLHYLLANQLYARPFTSIKAPITAVFVDQSGKLFG